MAVLEKWTGEAGAINPGASLTGADIGLKTGAALKGSETNRYGLKVVVDGVGSNYLQSAAWAAQTTIRKSFDLELPAGFTMAGGDQFWMCFVKDAALNVLAIRLLYEVAWGEIRADIAVKNDASSWLYFGAAAGDGITVGSRHSLELEAVASSAPGADDGTAKLILDGTVIIEATGIDNDTRDFDQFGIGAYDADAGTSGELLIDNIRVADAAGDEVYRQTFETNSYSNGETTSGTVSISSDAALGHTPSVWGLQVVINDTDDDFLETAVFASTYKSLYVRLDLKPSASFPMTDWESPIFCRFQDEWDPALNVDIVGNSGWDAPRLRLQTVEDGPVYVSHTAEADGEISLGEAQRIEVFLKISSAPGADDGEARLLLDGVEVITATGLDNDTFSVDRMRFGWISATNATAKTLFFDNIELRTDAYPGAYVGPTIPPAGLCTMQESEAGAVVQTIVDNHLASGAGWRLVFDASVGNLPTHAYVGVSPKTYTTDLVSSDANLANLWSWFIYDASAPKNMRQAETAATLAIDTAAVLQLSASGEYGDANYPYTTLTTILASGKVTCKQTDSPAVTVEGGYTGVYAGSSIYEDYVADATVDECLVQDTDPGGQDLYMTSFAVDERYAMDTAAGGVSGNTQYARILITDGSYAAGDYAEHDLISFLTDTDGSGERNDYRNPDPLDGSANAGEVLVGSLKLDDPGDDDGDGFNESEDVYVIDASGGLVRLKLDTNRGGANPYAFLKAGFKFVNWTGGVPAVIQVGGLRKLRDVDYVASLVGTTLYISLLFDIDADAQIVVAGGGGFWWWD